jgi:chromosome segregation ATPase
MVEPIMYFGIGFLVAALIGLVVLPLVHGRAVRLTIRRLEAAIPLSMAEIQADKDQLRAEFAMSTRRLEMSVEQLKTKSTGQLAELGKKGDAINRLKIELGERTATIFALEVRDKALRDQLRATEEEFTDRTSAMLEAERALTAKQDELARLMGELNERSSIAKAQKVEIVALKTHVDALKERLNEADDEVKAVEDRRDSERLELKAATQELTAEHGKVENLGRRVSQLEQQLLAQTTEAEILGRRAMDLENRLTDQSRLLTQNETETRHLLADIAAARKTEADLRAAIAELDGRANITADALKTERAQLEGELTFANDERARLAHELATCKRETEESWASERVENALLRERINDVAAEVARLASALEGPNSPIDAILATEIANDQASNGRPAESAEAAFGEASGPGNGNLVDRIRALQSHASRVSQSDEPTRN